jgi:hypothetical protein
MVSVSSSAFVKVFFFVAHITKSKTRIYAHPPLVKREMESKPRVKMKTHVGSSTSSFVDFFESSEPKELFESSHTSVVKAQNF